MDPSNDMLVMRDQGDSLTLSCTARGYPRPIITWSTETDSRIQVTTSLSTNTEGYLIITSNLTISNVLREDAGIHTCTANNTVGIESRSFNLTVFCKFIIGTSDFNIFDMKYTTLVLSKILFY